MLIDTNVWSELARPRPDANVQIWFADNLRYCVLSSIVLSEMQYGIALTEGRRRDDLRSFLDDLFIWLPSGISDFDARAAAAWGILRARLQREGQLIGERDMFIAAHALALDVPLVTRNVSDMERTGARIINPWETGGSASANNETHQRAQ